MESRHQSGHSGCASERLLAFQAHESVHSVRRCASVRVEPLLENPRAKVLTEQRVELLFGAVGLATSVLWNQLMLGVDILVEQFGQAALAQAATFQNISCAGTMLFFTMMPKRLSVKTISGLCMSGFAVMTALAFLFHQLLSQKQAKAELFLAVVVVNGVCTGMTQNLAASLSGNFDAAPKALLLGESLAPFVGVSLSMLVRLLGCESVAALPLTSPFLLTAIFA